MQCHVPRGTAEVNATLKDLKGEEAVIPTTSPFNLSVWPVQMTDGLWRLAVDYCRLNQEQTSTQLLFQMYFA